MHGATLFLMTLTVVSGITMIYLIRLNHIEKMTRIEHGMPEPDPSGSFSAMRNLGRLMIALAISLPFSFLLSKLFSLPDYVLIPGSLLLFGGFSLLYSSYIDSTNLK